MKKAGELSGNILKWTLKRIGVIWVLLVLSSVFAATSYSFNCVTPEDGVYLTSDSVFCEGSHYLPHGLKIDNNIMVDCNNAEIVGDGTGAGITINEKEDIEIRNCNITNYLNGIHVVNSTNVYVHKNNIYKNKEGIGVYQSEQVRVNNNVLTENAAGIHFSYCIGCEHTNNEMINNNQGFIVDYDCKSGDDVCPDKCDVTNDFDCPAVCGDGLCSKQGDCDCKKGQIPLNEGGGIETNDTEGTETNTTQAAAEETTEEEEAAMEIEFPKEKDEESPAPKEVVFPIVSQMTNSVPFSIFEELKIDEKTHEKALKYVTLEKKKTIQVSKIVVELKIKAKKDIPLLEFYEYFPKEMAESTDIISSPQKFKVVIKDPVIKLKLTNLKEGDERAFTFIISKDTLADMTTAVNTESFTVFKRIYPTKDGFINTLFALIILFYIYYLFYLKKVLKKYARYLHKNVMIDYFLITKGGVMKIMHLIPLIIVILFIFEVSVKVTIGLTLLKILVSIIFVVYAIMMIGVAIDVSDFRRRYNIRN